MTTNNLGLVGLTALIPSVLFCVCASVSSLLLESCSELSSFPADSYKNTVSTHAGELYQVNSSNYFTSIISSVCTCTCITHSLSNCGSKNLTDFGLRLKTYQRTIMKQYETGDRPEG